MFGIEFFYSHYLLCNVQLVFGLPVTTKETTLIFLFGQKITRCDLNRKDGTSYEIESCCIVC